MGLITRNKIYNCDNDCEMAGCPKHTATLSYHSVSDHLTFNDGKGNEMGMDLNTLRAFLIMLKEVGEVRYEIESVLKVLSNSKVEE